MKIKITKPDGTIVEAEGTAEECARFGEAPVVDIRIVPQPVYPVRTLRSYEDWRYPYWWETTSAGRISGVVPLTIGGGVAPLTAGSTVTGYPPGTAFSWTGASS